MFRFTNQSVIIPETIYFAVHKTAIFYTVTNKICNNSVVTVEKIKRIHPQKTQWINTILADEMSECIYEAAVSIKTLSIDLRTRAKLKILN